jgi:hypothetical protein
MTRSDRHCDVEARFRDLLDAAGLPAPEEVAVLERSIVFVWYEPEACVLVDLDELPEADDPFAGMDPDDFGIGGVTPVLH